MLKLDPAERATMPEVVTHCWLRMRHSTMFDLQHQPRSMGDSYSEGKEEKALLMGVGGIKMSLSPRQSLVGRSSKPTSPTSPLTLLSSLKSTGPLEPLSLTTSRVITESDTSPRGLPTVVTANNGNSIAIPDSDEVFKGVKVLSPRSKPKEGNGAGMIPIVLDAPLLTSPLHSRSRMEASPNTSLGLELPSLDVMDSQDERTRRKSPLSKSPSAGAIVGHRSGGCPTDLSNSSTLPENEALYRQHTRSERMVS